VAAPLRALLLLAAAAVLLTVPAVAADAPAKVLVAEFENDVNPVTQDYLLDAIERAEEDGYAAAVIEMDTPGGLASSMRDIVKGILAAEVPVIVYVAPGGASADSAGAVIGMAADVLAMAPQTNIGSSTPVSIGGEDISDDLRRKIVNDAAAYIGELAREHDRNVEVAR
jgi:membrane-bound serine protease (ClpP class)